jgi:hypothetical protein
MSAGFGVRVLQTGPDRLAVMARIRPRLDWSPARLKAAIDCGEPIVIATETSHSRAWDLVKEFERLGATVEAYVTDPCPCCGRDHHA